MINFESLVVVHVLEPAMKRALYGVFEAWVSSTSEANCSLFDVM